MGRTFFQDSYFARPIWLKKRVSKQWLPMNKLFGQTTLPELKHFDLEIASESDLKARHA
ncbi:hypothetical protein CRENPOLYSF1_30003 [Crenothrix polyspora]|uniref:Uncharacterized protein n=1 Tax=Crenothrix polyspora TaxID=360316 RepID=A0A1R4H8Y9_9GAMM|nr:hypothetical protein CRENPOLYSF1_30003 [Crenothrix polyspora]